MGHAILQKGHKGQGEAADAPKHCMHQVSLTGDDLSALSPQGPLKRARHSFRMKPEVRKEQSRPFKIPAVCTSITFLPCANTVSFVLHCLFFYLAFPLNILLKSVKEINTVVLRKINREHGVFVQGYLFSSCQSTKPQLSKGQGQDCGH